MNRIIQSLQQLAAERVAPAIPVSLPFPRFFASSRYLNLCTSQASSHAIACAAFPHAFRGCLWLPINGRYFVGWS